VCKKGASVRGNCTLVPFLLLMENTPQTSRNKAFQYFHPMMPVGIQFAFIVNVKVSLNILRKGGRTGTNQRQT